MKLTTWIAYALRLAGCSALETLGSLADRLDEPIDTPTPEERSLNQEGMLARLHNLREHRCQSCDGHGAKKTEDGNDYYACPDCHGQGVNLKELLEIHQ